MRTWGRRIGLGVILWFVPYAAAILMLGYAHAHPLGFKAAEVCIATLTMAGLVVWYFRDVERDFLREAVLTAATWAVINWALDLVALLPFTHQSLPQYFLEIGIEYLAACAYVIAVGAILAQKATVKESAPPRR